MVSNRDIGFVHPGEPADVKIDTFNHTRYGLLHGEVETVSGDAVTPDKREDNPNVRPTRLDKNTAAWTDTGAKEPVYAARVSLDKTAMVVDDKRINLTPGMAVTVEIKTGSRHIISYLLSPLLCATVMRAYANDDKCDGPLRQRGLSSLFSLPETS
jgi:hemolysin D